MRGAGDDVGGLYVLEIVFVGTDDRRFAVPIVTTSAGVSIVWDTSVRPDTFSPESPRRLLAPV